MDLNENPEARLLRHPGISEAMLDWLKGWLRRPAAAPTPRVRLDVTKYGIGFCPGCKRLRGVASARCLYCGSVVAVTADP